MLASDSLTSITENNNYRKVGTFIPVYHYTDTTLHNCQ